MSFPFKYGSAYDVIQRNLVKTINDPMFDFNLPELSDSTWATICDNDEERERLEFVGDALMSAAVAEELYRTFTNGSPGLYTETRSALTANATFAHLMQKLGFHSTCDPVKPAGDAFETIIAAYHKERGSDALRLWVRCQFLPLIHAAGAGYYAHRGTVTTRRHKQHNQLVHALGRSPKTPKLQLSRQRKILIKSRYSRHSLPKDTPMRIPPLAQTNDIKIRPVIDLTVDSDWEDVDDQSPSNGRATGSSEQTEFPPMVRSYTPITPAHILRSISRRPTALGSHRASTSPSPAMASSRGFRFAATLSSQSRQAHAPSSCNGSVVGSSSNPIALD